MSKEVIVYGPPQSSYVRTARWVCAEKGVEHRLEPVELGSEEHERLHPFRRVPSMRHGDVQLYETSAIARYVDAAFDGPSLIPGRPADAAKMEQWISAINCYLYGRLIKDFALAFLVPTFQGKEPDLAVVEAALPAAERGLDLLDEGYRVGDGHLAGGTLTLADLFVGPIVTTVGAIPPGQEALASRKALMAAYEKLSSRPAFQAIQPPPPKG